jgi:predicted Ser/Thr protein kinase
VNLSFLPILIQIKHAVLSQVYGNSCDFVRYFRVRGKLFKTNKRREMKMSEEYSTTSLAAQARVFFL